MEIKNLCERYGLYLASMEFDTTVSGKVFTVSYLKRNTYLVSSGSHEYIVYKTDVWKCAEDLHKDLLEQLGEAIENHLSSK
jgi:hypothetical protein